VSAWKKVIKLSLPNNFSLRRAATRLLRPGMSARRALAA